MGEGIVDSLFAGINFDELFKGGLRKLSELLVRMDVWEIFSKNPTQDNFCQLLGDFLTSYVYPNVDRHPPFIRYCFSGNHPVPNTKHDGDFGDEDNPLKPD